MSVTKPVTKSNAFVKFSVCHRGTLFDKLISFSAQILITISDMKFLKLKPTSIVDDKFKDKFLKSSGLYKGEGLLERGLDGRFYRLLHSQHC